MKPVGVKCHKKKHICTDRTAVRECGELHRKQQEEESNPKNPASVQEATRTSSCAPTSESPYFPSLLLADSNSPSLLLADSNSTGQPSSSTTTGSDKSGPSGRSGRLRVHSKCSKGFPKEFCSKTEWDDNAFYPVYKRSCPEDGGVKFVRGSKIIDNRNVVHYSPALSFLLEAHINVELCVSPTAAKYLFKYTLKGQDRAMASVGYDEVEDYLNFRSIGSSCAVWRLEKFDLTFRYPAVVALRIHLPGENYVIYEEGTEDEVAARGQKTTELDGFFAFNAAHPDTEVKYVDFPRHFVLKNKREWHQRKRGKFGGTIGRIHTVHPIQSPETFYLRVLLHHDHCMGKTSFEDLRTFDGTICETYKETCQKLHLLKDDAEWHDALQEAGFMMFPKQVRSLFVAIVLCSEPSSPRKLFFDNHEEMNDDFKRKFPSASEEQLIALILRDIEEQLKYAGKNLATFGLPPVLPQLIQQLHNEHSIGTSSAEAGIPVILREELSFDLEATADTARDGVAKLTQSQRCVFDKVMMHIAEAKPLALFIDASGGTGKTFTLNTILASVRSMNAEKHIALAVASSGIAAILLAQGRTAHSRFKIPINANKDPTASFKISPTDQLAKVIRDAKVIVWDEAPMTQRFLIEGLDHMLRDILRVPQLFGGKVVVFSGDFRQTLPVVVRGNRGRIVDASLKKSSLWKQLYTMRLTEQHANSQREHSSEYPVESGKARYLTLSIGDGSTEIVELPDSIALPQTMVYQINTETSIAYKASVRGFIDIIFPQLLYILQNDEPGALEKIIDFLSERAILAPKNQMVDNINFIISEINYKKFVESAVNCLHVKGIPEGYFDTTSKDEVLYAINRGPFLCEKLHSDIVKSSQCLLETERNASLKCNSECGTYKDNLMEMILPKLAKNDTKEMTKNSSTMKLEGLGQYCQFMFCREDCEKKVLEAAGKSGDGKCSEDEANQVAGILDQYRKHLVDDKKRELKGMNMPNYCTIFVVRD